MLKVPVGPFILSKDSPLTVFCGPCVIESETFLIEAAHELKEIFAQFPFQFVFKSSYDKANRSSVHSFRGPGVKKGLEILQRIKEELCLPILTDVHTPQEAHLAGQISDVIQIPAFLCRQTDLLLAAAQTNATINVKKGQFLSPYEMKNVIEKLESCGTKKIFVTDRGTSFGYNNLVTDLRAIPIMQSFGYPVCFDATHSVQMPGELGTKSGGQREFIPTLAKGALAAGANALFIEAHPDPDQAKSDAATMIPFKDLPNLLFQFEKIYEAAQCVCASSV